MEATIQIRSKTNLHSIEMTKIMGDGSFPLVLPDIKQETGQDNYQAPILAINTSRASILI